MSLDGSFAAHLLEIIWINILLSGDNAVVIALACHSLPPRQRRWGIILGTTPAVLIRIGCALIVTWLMAIPYLRLAGGLVLLWIAIGLLRDAEEEEAHVREGTTLWAAVRIIIVADIVMSLDNVLAIVGIAKGSVGLVVTGIAISVPLVIFGSAILVSVMDRFPVLVTAGGILIGYVAGDVAVGDPALGPWLGDSAELLEIAAPFACAALIPPVAHLFTRFDMRRRPAPPD
jgi:YjbE family integral membrane protein